MKQKISFEIKERVRVRLAKAVRETLSRSATHRDKKAFNRNAQKRADRREGYPSRFLFSSIYYSPCKKNIL